MKFSLTTNQLLETMSILSKIPTKHPSLPALSYTRLTVTETHLEIIVHGVGVSGVALLAIDGEVLPGRVALEHSPFMAFLQSANGGNLTCDLVEGVLVCTVGDSVAELKTVPADEIQEFPIVQGDPWYVGAASAVGDCLKRVSFACAASDIRPELAAVYLAGKGGQLVAAATDSFYLAEVKIPTASISEDSFVLIPNKYTADILRVLGVGSKLTLTIGEGMARFDVGTVSLVIRTVAGSYPQYEQIIPREFTATLETLRDDVKNALRTILPFTDQSFPKITLKPDSVESMCVCETDYNEKGHGKSAFRGLMHGELFEVRVNAENIMKIMGVLSVERLVFSFVDPMKPIVVTSPDDTAFRALLMPLGR